MRPFNRLILLTTFTASLAYAQDISGNWQGTINAGPQEVRLIVTIDKDSVGGWKGTLFSIDQTPDGASACRQPHFRWMVQAFGLRLAS